MAGGIISVVEVAFGSHVGKVGEIYFPTDTIEKNDGTFDSFLVQVSLVIRREVNGIGI